MRQITLKLSSVCFVLALALCSVLPVFAEAKDDADADTLTINKEAQIAVGDIVTYTLNLSEAPEPIVGFELRLFYDSDFLEYQKSSLTFDKFDMVIYNEDIKGKLPIEEKGQFVSASFKALKGGDAAITYFFTELYGENLEYLKRYKFTYDLTVNGEAILSDATPPVNEDENTLQNNQGDFINYADGMGEENSPLKPEEHIKVGSVVQNNVVEVTRVVSNAQADSTAKGSFFTSSIFYLLGGVVVVGAIVAAVVIVSAKAKKCDQ